ncbi:HDL188Wp [Eremothecium sinecaudum]|uniref:HDL188Wp n=1 Tax=Eremothecium sinecaudum TaxID=45286 RepID=A0A0X8HSC0_9SACH|nr:HDL188Wp [Eremothecium sinecaudum]AMD20556.1 HDL188Wp [Eremothecium sinecaudum]
MRIKQKTLPELLPMLSIRGLARTPTSFKRFFASTPEETFIYGKLRDALQPSALKVTDISGGCGSMFAIDVTSSRFKGLTTVKQHRLVNEVLKEDIKKWHGLQLNTKAE